MNNIQFQLLANFLNMGNTNQQLQGNFLTQVPYATQQYPGGTPINRTHSSSRQRQSPKIYDPYMTRVPKNTIGEQLYNTYQNGSPHQQHFSPTGQLAANQRNNTTLPPQMPYIPRNPYTTTPPPNHNHQYVQPNQITPRNKSQDAKRAQTPQRNKSSSKKIQQKRDKLRQQLFQGNESLPQSLSTNIKITFL